MSAIGTKRTNLERENVAIDSAGLMVITVAFQRWQPNWFAFK